MDNGLSRVLFRGLNKGFGLNVPEGYSLWQKTLEEGQGVQLLKRYEYKKLGLEEGFLTFK